MAYARLIAFCLQVDVSSDLFSALPAMHPAGVETSRGVRQNHAKASPENEVVEVTSDV